MITEIEKLKKPVRNHVRILAAIVGLISMIISIASLVGFEMIFSKNFFQIPSEFVEVLATVMSIFIGVGTFFYLAMYLYRRQVKERIEAHKALREREKELFQNIDSDIEILLKEGSH